MCEFPIRNKVMVAQTVKPLHQPVASDADFEEYRGQWVAVAMSDGHILIRQAHSLPFSA